MTVHRGQFGPIPDLSYPPGSPGVSRVQAVSPSLPGKRHEFCANLGLKRPITRENTIESLLMGIGTDVNGFNHVKILNRDNNCIKFTSILCLRSLIFEICRFWTLSPGVFWWPICYILPVLKHKVTGLQFSQYHFLLQQFGLLDKLYYLVKICYL